MTLRSIRFDPAPVLGPDEPPATREWYADRSGAFTAGFWSAPPDRFEVAYEEDEFCVIVAGVVRLTDAEGHVEIYRQGDAFVIPSGFKGIWETVETVSKYYVIYLPKP